jgi:TonB family protein
MISPKAEPLRATIMFQYSGPTVPNRPTARGVDLHFGYMVLAAHLLLISMLTYLPPRLVTAPPPSAPFNVVIGDTVLPVAHVNEEGGVAHVAITEGASPFADEVIKAINQWSFAPGQLDGHAVASEVSVLMMFRPHALGNAGLRGPTFGFKAPKIPEGDHPSLPHFIFDPGWPVTQLGNEGVVILELDIADSGRVDGVRVVRDLPGMTDYAIGAVRQWDFTPAVVNGMPVAARAIVGISFVYPVLSR